MGAFLHLDMAEKFGWKVDREELSEYVNIVIVLGLGMFQKSVVGIGTKLIWNLNSNKLILWNTLCGCLVWFYSSSFHEQCYTSDQFVKTKKLNYIHLKYGRFGTIYKVNDHEPLIFKTNVISTASEDEDSESAKESQPVEFASSELVLGLTATN